MKLWHLAGIVFALAAGIYFLAGKGPGLFIGSSPKPKFINYDTVAQTVKPNTVKINNYGYGAVVHERGYILTTVEAAARKPPKADFYVTAYSGKSFGGDVIKTDKRSGLVLLKVMVEPDAGDFSPIQSANPRKVKPGDPIFVPAETGTVMGKVVELGQTLDIGDAPRQARNAQGAPQPAVAGGAVPATNKAPAPAKARKYSGLILSDLVLDSSYNGAPVYDAPGDIVGLCLIPEAAAGAKNGVYIIPIARSKRLLAATSRLIPEMTYTQQGMTQIVWLGAVFIPQVEFNGNSLLAAEIKQDSVWTGCGLQVNDRIIRIDKNQVTGLIDVEKTLPALANYRKVNIDLIRAGREKKISLQLKRVSFERNNSLFTALFVVLFLATMYYVVYKNWIDRTIVFVLGAAAITMCGYYLDFYDWQKAWESLAGRLDVIVFILGMNILAVILDEGGLFDNMARKIITATKGDTWKIMMYFCILTYGASLFINNLTVIMVVLPMLFTLSRCLKFDPKPYMIGIIIASNLGGASTMIGDFPNILISTEAGIGFSKFLVYMMPPCLAGMAALLFYMRFKWANLFAAGSASASEQELQRCIEELPQLEEFIKQNRKNGKDRLKNAFINSSAALRKVFAAAPGSALPGVKKEKQSRNPATVKRGLIILGAVIAALFACEFIGLAPAIVVMAGGIIALCICKVDVMRVLERLSYKDIFFFAGLFILVGAAEASGLLAWFGKAMLQLSFGSILVRCFLLMGLASLITAFLNAGPSTALLLPIVMSFRSPAPHYIDFWALSLGVLAGSSATLTGATAGSVSANMLSEYLNINLSFKEYAKTGLPVALIFLVIAVLYIALIY